MWSNSAPRLRTVLVLAWSLAPPTESVPLADVPFRCILLSDAPCSFASHAFSSTSFGQGFVSPNPSTGRRHSNAGLIMGQKAHAAHHGGISVAHMHSWLVRLSTLVACSMDRMYWPRVTNPGSRQLVKARARGHPLALCDECDQSFWFAFRVGPCQVWCGGVMCGLWDGEHSGGGVRKTVMLYCLAFWRGGMLNAWNPSICHPFTGHPSGALLGPCLESRDPLIFLCRACDHGHKPLIGSLRSQTPQHRQGAPCEANNLLWCDWVIPPWSFKPLAVDRHKLEKPHVLP